MDFGRRSDRPTLSFVPKGYRCYLDHHSHHILSAGRTKIPFGKRKTLTGNLVAGGLRTSRTLLGPQPMPSVLAIQIASSDHSEGLTVQPQVDQPSFHAETCSLRICTTFLPDVYISGGDGAPFLSVQSASYKWEGVLSNCMEDVKCIPCGTYTNVFEGRLLHIYQCGGERSWDLLVTGRDYIDWCIRKFKKSGGRMKFKLF
jgi:hypothetical protein